MAPRYGDRQGAANTLLRRGNQRHPPPCSNVWLRKLMLLMGNYVTFHITHSAHPPRSTDCSPPRNEQIMRSSPEGNREGQTAHAWTPKHCSRQIYPSPHLYPRQTCDRRQQRERGPRLGHHDRHARNTGTGRGPPGRRERACPPLIHTAYRTRQLPLRERAVFARTLGDAEVQMVHLVASGASIQEIADVCRISRDTAKARLKLLRGRVGAENNAHLVTQGWRYGWLDESHEVRPASFLSAVPTRG
ncbi:helix-turn-helix transcriptional regulator [Streptomyces sp. NPDC032198]|uniref:helix-turn-helix transcriptional regulator n=1 Tax=Streptomyces sp. NPDC032198 TaxID=3155127 RepID=UPI0033E98C28